MNVHKGSGGDFINADTGGALGGWTFSSSGTNNGQQRFVAKGGGQPHNNLQPYLDLAYLIKG